MKVRTCLGAAFLIVQSTFWPFAAGAQDWEVIGTGLIRYTTHGQVVHGHQFGFVKPPRQCDADVLWLSWSSHHPEAPTIRGADAVFAADVDGTKFKMGVRARIAEKPWSILTVVAFSDYFAGPKLIELLKSGSDQPPLCGPV